MANPSVKVTFSQPEAPAADAAPAKQRVSAFDLVASQPWAILPDMLETIAAVARRDNENVEAVEARLGRKLQNTRTVATRGNVAIIPVTGPVFRYANLFTDISGATSLEVLAQDFTAALDNPNIASIVLNMDSPGGQATGISEFAHMVRASSKPVIAYVDGQAASAAYWIASAADEIVLGKTSEVGSVGAVVSIDPSRRGETIEIVSSQSPKKRPDITTDEGRAQIQSRIDSFAQVFIEDVAAYRGTSVDAVLDKFGQGDMRMGKEAIAHGMADRISTLEDVISGLLASPPPHVKKGVTMTAPSGAPAAETPVITREYLAQHHADIVSAIEQDAAATERARIQNVEAQALSGHEALIQTLKFDGHTTGAEAAVQVLAAEKTANSKRLETFYAGAPQVPHAAAPADAAPPENDEHMTADERARRDWESKPGLHKEFSSVNAYAAYLKASQSGRAKVFGQTKE